MEENVCKSENYSTICPLYDAHDKLEESFHFLMMMASSYHVPDCFRFNLHAFLQALRSVTLFLQKRKDIIPGFEAWYANKQEEMKKNTILKNVCETRNIIVHERSLKSKSKVEIGLYRGRKLKLGIMLDYVNPLLDSKTIFEMYVPKFFELGFMDEEHSAIGEQLGIMRGWYCEELGDDEILKTCYAAYLAICRVVYEAHSFFGLELVPQGIPENFFDDIYVVLESDMDPSLPEKWGW